MAGNPACFRVIIEKGLGVWSSALALTIGEQENLSPLSSVCARIINFTERYVFYGLPPLTLDPSIPRPLPHESVNPLPRSETHLINYNCIPKHQSQQSPGHDPRSCKSPEFYLTFTPTYSTLKTLMPGPQNHKAPKFQTTITPKNPL